MPPTRKICVVTGTRAEYGLLYWLMREIDQDPGLELQILATGAHLSERYGSTAETIEQDGFTINARVPVLDDQDTPLAVAHAIARGLDGCAQAFDQLKPDAVVVLGDRYEILAAAQAAAVLGIRVAHIHGGELSEGVFDDAARHCVTKLAHYHFVAAEPYRQRVIQLGEQPDRVFNHGAPGLDHTTRTALLTRDQLEKQIGLTLTAPVFVVTYHPATLDASPIAAQLDALLNALDRHPDAHIIFTGSNADAGGQQITRRLTEYTQRNPNRAVLHASLGTPRYLSAVKHAHAVIGNSSSGLIEAPALGTPTVNIGDRQRGRLRADSVIDCNPTPDAIAAAIDQALSPAFQAKAARTQSPYGHGDASQKIKDTLKSLDLTANHIKRFHDLPTPPRVPLQHSAV